MSVGTLLGWLQKDLRPLLPPHCLLHLRLELHRDHLGYRLCQKREEEVMMGVKMNWNRDGLYLLVGGMMIQEEKGVSDALNLVVVTNKGLALDEGEIVTFQKAYHRVFEEKNALTEFESV